MWTTPFMAHSRTTFFLIQTESKTYVEAEDAFEFLVVALTLITALLSFHRFCSRSCCRDHNYKKNQHQSQHSNFVQTHYLEKNWAATTYCFFLVSHYGLLWCNMLFSTDVYLYKRLPLIIWLSINVQIVSLLR